MKVSDFKVQNHAPCYRYYCVLKILNNGKKNVIKIMQFLVKKSDSVLIILLTFHWL